MLSLQDLWCTHMTRQKVHRIIESDPNFCQQAWNQQGEKSKKILNEVGEKISGYITANSCLHLCLYKQHTVRACVCVWACAFTIACKKIQLVTKQTQGVNTKTFVFASSNKISDFSRPLLAAGQHHVPIFLSLGCVCEPVCFSWNGECENKL